MLQEVEWKVTNGQYEHVSLGGKYVMAVLTIDGFLIDYTVYKDFAKATIGKNVADNIINHHEKKAVVLMLSDFLVAFSSEHEKYKKHFMAYGV